MVELEIKNLKIEINKHNYNYYVLDNPTISDYEYDQLFTRLKELEAVNFDSLSEPEKKLKIKELKEMYVVIYKKCGTISEMLSEIRKDEETIQVIDYISNTLIDLKHYVNDYITEVFDIKTYAENLSQLHKYITIFYAINTVFDQIKRENEE